MARFDTEKLYYSIGEVAKIADIPQYLIRTWENSFTKFSPSRNAKGNRIFTSKDISILLAIKKLIKEHGYTIEKAKEIIDSVNDAEIKANEVEVKHQAKSLKNNDAIPKAIHEQKEVLKEIRQLVAEGLSLLKEIEAIDIVESLSGSIRQIMSTHQSKVSESDSNVKSLV